VTDSSQETLALARTAARAVRSLNHATLGGEGLDWPADAYELIGELALAAAGHPHILTINDLYILIFSDREQVVSRASGPSSSRDRGVTGQ
jgi:hypothetical protein